MMARWKDWLQRGGLETMALLIGPMLLFGPPLLRGQALFWGTPLLQFTPWRHFAFEVLAGGDLPLWNPGLGMGAPLIANYQLAFFYPPSWILALIDIAWGQTLLVMLHLMLAAVGMERLARKVGISRQGAVLAGMAFSMSGYLVARASFLSIIWAAAWLPWLLWAVEVLLARLHPSRVSNRKLIGGVILLAVVLAMQWLSGHAQTSWYSSLLVAAWTIWRGRQLGGRRLSLQLATAVGLAVVLALLVAAIQLLPTGIYLAASQRAGAVDRGLAMAYSFWPWRLIELATPNLFGSPGAGNYWGYAAHWEDALYMGMLPVLMAAGALFWPSERARRWRWFFVPLIGLTFLLALGENTPVFPFLYEHVPTFSLFQAPTRWNVFLVFGFAFLAGLGYDGWAPPQGRWLYWIRLATAGAGVIGLAAWLGSRLLGSVEATFVPALAASGAMLFLVGILSLTRRKPLGFRWRLAMYALVILDLILATATLNPWQELALQQGNASLPQRVDSEHRLYMPLAVEYEIKFEQSFRFNSFLNQDWNLVREAGLPNTTLFDGLRSANNFDPLLPGRYLIWMGALEGLQGDQRLEMLALMDVGALAELDPDQPSGVAYRALADPRRVRIVGEGFWAATEQEALQRTLDPQFDPDSLVILEAPLPPQPLGPAGEAGQLLSLEEQGPNRLVLRFRADRPAWLVLSDLWYPGWEAQLDGERIPILRADYLFKAVQVPAGEHQLSFEYRPPGFRVGLGLSLLGIGLLTAGWLWGRGR